MYNLLPLARSQECTKAPTLNPWGGTYNSNG
jgi:hypothetical protein